MLGAHEGIGRADARDGGTSDRIGRRSADYHLAVDRAFRDIAAKEPARVRLVDASGSAETVTARLMADIGDLLP